MFVKEQKQMASKIVSARVKHTGYLAGYFALLLYTVSGLMFQGSVWLLAGALCWFGIVSRFFGNYIYNYNKKRLEEISLRTERQKREETNGDQKGKKSILNFGFLSQ
jgi:hypothetical protein